MSPDVLDLPHNLDNLRAFADAMQAQLNASEQALEAERAAHRVTRSELDAAKNAIQLTALQIEKLRFSWPACGG